MTRTHAIEWDCLYCARRATRREFLAGLGAVGGAALLPSPWLGQTATGTVQPFRIDVHHHFASPGFVAEMTKRNVGNPRYRRWTPQVSLDDMDEGAVATSILSSSRPGVWFGDVALARSLARALNEFGTQTATDFPGRFGLFATLPLPDVDSTLREIEYVYDVLHADGVAVMSNYDGMYLGDPEIDFVKLAQSQGLEGVRVDNSADLRPALKRGIAATREGTPFLLDVRVRRNR